MDGHEWKTVAKGQGNSDHMSIAFNTVQAQYIRIKEMAKGSKPWSMRMLKLYAIK
jgi:hypothetical protein